MKKILLALLLVLPTMLFAKGEIVGYHQSWRGAVPDAQLDKIDILIMFQVLPNFDGTLDNKIGSWFNKTWVENAQKKGVKVCVAIGGWDAHSPGAANWVSAASDANRTNFVNNIVNLVNQYGLDGLDIDWEYPQGAAGWSQFMKLCNELRARLPGKRLSTALPGSNPTDSYYTSVVREQIWTALDAIQLMAYDMTSWGNHADLAKSKKLIDDWAEWGKNSAGFNKEKLFLGVPFYTRPGEKAWKDFGNQTLFNQDQNGSDTYNGAPTLKNKTEHCYTKGYGGIMIWELGHDFPATNNLSLLKVIYDETQRLGGGVITPPKRHDVPGNIAACEGTINNGQCEGTNVGYLVSGSSVDYLIKVTQGAGSYKIKMKTAEGNNVAQTITISGAGANGTISVPGGSDWAAYTERETDIQLNNGDGTLKISVTGAVNFKDISITKNSGTEPQICSVCGKLLTECICVILPTDDPDLADGTWGDAWSAVYDEGKNGSSLSITSQGNPLTATWKLGDEPDWETAGDDDAPYAGIGFYTGDAADWSKITEVVIQYSSNQSTYLALSSSNGHEYFVELPAGNNKTMTFTVSDFQKFEWDAGSHSLKLSEVNGIVVAALDSYGATTNITITSLVVKGLLFEDEPPVAILPNKTTKSVSVMSVGIMNGTFSLSLPATAKNAMVTLFDVRGRMLMQQQISINSGVASVALPKNIARNQAAILQVRTNSGINLTKRVLIK